VIPMLIGSNSQIIADERIKWAYRKYWLLGRIAWWTASSFCRLCI
jgi:hypothetical protein